MLRAHIIAVIALAFEVSGCAGGSRAAPFLLHDDVGRPWSLAAQRGKGIALTFGYTHCRDTCPLVLGKLARALQIAGPQAQNIEVVFITVDPERDTPAALRAYLRDFGSEFVGLTGTHSQIEAVERSYHVWAERIPGRRGNDDYDDAHSSTIFLIDPHGNIASLHDPDDSVADLARGMQGL